MARASREKADPPPAGFAAWKRSLFDRSDELCCIYDDSIEDFVERSAAYDYFDKPPNLLELFIYTMRHLPAIVKNSTDKQIAFGLNSIFNNSYSDLPHDLLEAEFTPALRLEAIESIYDLYAGFLRVRCTPVLGHQNEGGTELEAFHYMLWDVTPLTAWCTWSASASQPSPLLSMLERVLYIPHDGCIESALHGFGHMSYRRQDGLIAKIIDHFIESAPGLRPQMQDYALAARKGYVQ